MIARFNLAFSVTVFLLGLVSLLLSLTGWSGVSLDEWLAPHSGAHRIFVTRFLMVFDYAYLGGKNTSIYLSVWSSVVVLLLVYIRAARTSCSGLQGAHVFVAGLALIYICSPTQYWNIVNPINASWYVAFAASAASVWILISCGKELSARMAFLACSLSAVAALSNFSGLLCCLMLPVIVLYHRSRNCAWVVLFSVVFVLLYMRGIESGIANLGKSEVFQEAVRAAIAADPKLATPPPSFFDSWFRKFSGAASNTGLHLGAPLSVKYASLASWAVLISVIFLGYIWISLGLNWYKKNDPIPKALEFYLVMATICLGVSAAIWLGRGIYANPAAERYQTITMLYWLSISRLVLCQFRPVTNIPKPLITLISVAVIPLILLSGMKTFSLSRITGVSESAGRTQILGGMGLARLKVDNAVFVNTKRDYFAEYFDFLSGYSYTQMGAVLPLPEQGVFSDDRCSKLKVATKLTHWPDIQRVSLSFDSNASTFLRRMDLIGAKGERGRLYFVASKQYQ